MFDFTKPAVYYSISLSIKITINVVLNAASWGQYDGPFEQQDALGLSIFRLVVLNIVLSSLVVEKCFENPISFNYLQVTS